MKKYFLSSFLLLLISYYSFSQNVGIGTTAPNTSAALDITSPIKGLLIPRMNMPGILAIATPAKGLLVYDSAANQLMVNIGSAALPNWQSVASGNNSGWSLSGNSGTNPANQFIGTTDNQPLQFRVNNLPAGALHPLTGNIFWGLRAGEANTTGFNNIAIGKDALKSDISGRNSISIGDSALFNNRGSDRFSNIAIGSKSLFSNIGGQENTAIGDRSLFSNDGSSNTAIGNRSLFSNTNGSINTAIGNHSLFSNLGGNGNTASGTESLFGNTTGNNNTATGNSALRNNTTASGNTAIGASSLFSNTIGINNTANGSQSLLSNTTGSFNTAIANASLFLNTTGSRNTATGFQSLLFNTTGGGNTATGGQSLTSNTTGSFNTAAGDESLVFNTTGIENTAIGRQAMDRNTAGSFNVALGSGALFATTASQFNTAVGFNAGSGSNMGFNNTLIGANTDLLFTNGIFNSVALGESVTCDGSNQVRFGNTSTESIGGFAGYTDFSDGRYKKNIQEGVKGIDFIMKLRPVTYQLDITGLNKKLNVHNSKEINSQTKKSIAVKEQTIFTGFIAQEVEQAAKTIGYDFSGVDKPENENGMYGLRYAGFVVPLVKAMQEQQAMMEAMKKRIDALEQQNKLLQQLLTNKN
jgi:trimeric autotransporter adhesin